MGHSKGKAKKMGEATSLEEHMLKIPDVMYLVSHCPNTAVIFGCLFFSPFPLLPFPSWRLLSQSERDREQELCTALHFVLVFFVGSAA